MYLKDDRPGAKRKYYSEIKKSHRKSLPKIIVTNVYAKNLKSKIVNGTYMLIVVMILPRVNLLIKIPGKQMNL